jgi:peroxiredoxin 2/4
LDKRMEEFRARGVEVVSVSVDSQFTHNAYRNTAVDKGGIGPVHYTLAADVAHTICQSYGVEHPEAKVAFRGAFIIDNNGFVRSQIVNDLPIGRNIDEILRIVDAVQFTEEHGEVCPAGWQKGKSGMKASPQGVEEYLSSHTDEL